MTQQHKSIIDSPVMEYNTDNITSRQEHFLKGNSGRINTQDVSLVG
jgi:hypothetical protein